MNLFKQITTSLEILENFGSPYVILLSCLVAQIFLYIYFTFNALLNVIEKTFVSEWWGRGGGAAFNYHRVNLKKPPLLMKFE